MILVRLLDRVQIQCFLYIDNQVSWEKSTSIMLVCIGSLSPTSNEIFFWEMVQFDIGQTWTQLYPYVTGIKGSIFQNRQIEVSSLVSLCQIVVTVRRNYSRPKGMVLQSSKTWRCQEKCVIDSAICRYLQ